MVEVSFYTQEEIDDSLFRFAVIAARENGQWLFCRHRERSTWEIPGGHREPGEAIEAAARRELFEETGAISFELSPVCAYGVESGGQTTYGMLYFAEVKSRGALCKESEIGQVMPFSLLLSNESSTYPHIQPHLFRRVQWWLNTRSSADELWDLYDAQRRKTGRLHRRGDPLKEGDYYISVHVWLLNARGEFLLTKRSPNKGYPHMWECTGGSVLAGEDSLTAAVREVAEETGLKLSPQDGQLLFTLHRDGVNFCDVYLFRYEFDLEKVTLLPGETCDKMAASPETIRKMQAEGKLCPFTYLEQLFEAVLH